MGAQWLHGKENPVFKFAEKQDLVAGEDSSEGDGIFVRNDGMIIDDHLIKEVDFEVGRILYECEKFIDSDKWPTSVESYLQSRFQEYLNMHDDTDDVKQMKMQLLDWHARFQLIDNSCNSVGHLSARQWGKYEIDLHMQHHINLKIGYKSVIEALINDFPTNIIHLNCPVSEIRYDNLVTLNCQDTTILAKHVIVTSSIGVLRDNLINNIYPPLPQEMQNAIESIGFDAMGKVFLVYNCNWWDKYTGFQLLWETDTGLNESEYWLRYISGFDAVANKPGVLLGWIGGKGVEMMEKLTEDEIAHHCTKLLRNHLKQVVSDVPFPQKVFK